MFNNLKNKRKMIQLTGILLHNTNLTLVLKYKLLIVFLSKFQLYFNPQEFCFYYYQFLKQMFSIQTEPKHFLNSKLFKILSNKKNNKIIYILHFFFSKKNTIIHLSDLFNQQIHHQWSTKSLKKLEMRKNTRYNMKIIANQIILFLKKNKYFLLAINIKGNSFGTKSMLRYFNKNYFYFFFIKNSTNKVFNGCRRKKKKRK